MNQLVPQHLVVEKIENWHNGMKYMQWKVLNVPKYETYTENVAQDFYNFTNVVKFRQIWSHCLFHN